MGTNFAPLVADNSSFVMREDFMMSFLMISRLVLLIHPDYKFILILFRQTMTMFHAVASLRLSYQMLHCKVKLTKCYRLRT